MKIQCKEREIYVKYFHNYKMIEISFIYKRFIIY